eukprot:TRINITY_DN6466_c0_g1_i1.p1 TRINITY_DN6466_c0_g1~~TRINITY_DN6466_c0_g1_i1.p1  ORF type:complete len:291 (+),score=55.34 TRINITY_DN6466_c0_g1_i1:221-1093(+)
MYAMGLCTLTQLSLLNSFGSAEVQNGFTLDLWGTQLADVCTGNAFYGCERTSGAGGNILNPIQSARIRTAESFNFKYGTVEVRAKLPKGDWLWPAIWMLPRYNSYGAWPASGEFDIVESRGNSASYSAGGVNTFGSTLHWGPYAGQDKYPSTHAMYKLPSGDFSQDFHVFGLVWNESIIYTYVDSPSNIVLKVDTSSESFYNKGGFSSIGASNPWEGSNINAPFDQEFFLVFDLAVGGTGGYFPDGMGNKPWSDTSSSAVNQFYSAINQWYPTWKDSGSLQIDYVKVYSW